MARAPRRIRRREHSVWEHGRNCTRLMVARGYPTMRLRVEGGWEYGPH